MRWSGLPYQDSSALRSRKNIYCTLLKITCKTKGRQRWSGIKIEILDLEIENKKVQ